MKRFYALILLVSCFCFAINLQAQERYLDEVFTETEQMDSVIYGANTTILPLLQPGGVPTLRPLFVNIITPKDDTETERPLILMFHTGNFLPILINGNNNGTLNDAYVNVLAQRLARMGYAVGIVDYRKGWNPLGTQEQRTNTLINAAYRGVQDANTCMRFFRKTEAAGNPFGIDGDRITVWGIGTGGYISLAAATLDRYEDVVLPKFIGSDINGDGNPDPMVLPFINGDPFALEVGVNPLTGDTLCFPNHTEPGLSSEAQLCVNMGGAVGDESWVDASDPPTISFHVPSDPFAPYTRGIVVVPTTGDNVVEVDGSYNVSKRGDDLGNNDVWDSSTFDDPYSEAANSRNDGLEGLFPMPRPNWDLTDDMMDNPIPVEASPWEFWDETFWSTAPWGQLTLDEEGAPCEGIPIEFCNWHLAQLGSNPDMSLAKATMYQDSIVNYFAPRACVALQLPCAINFTSTEDLVVNNVTLTPNPSANNVYVNAHDNLIRSIKVMDMSGKLMQTYTSINSTQYTIKRGELSTGMYIAILEFEEGIQSMKFVLE